MHTLFGGTAIRWPGTRVGFRSAGSGGLVPALHFPSPPLWIPAFAGMTSSALVTTSCFHFRTNLSSRPGPAHQGMKTGVPVGRAFCTVARGQGRLPVCRERGTSPSPRVVFDRATFSQPRPSWIPTFAGMTKSALGRTGCFHSRDHGETSKSNGFLGFSFQRTYIACHKSFTTWVFSLPPSCLDLAFP